MNYMYVTDNDKMLIIAPHPDDESIGCGGLISMYPKQCEILVMTDGGRGDINTSYYEMTQIRKTEFERAVRQVGIEAYRFLDYSDGELILYPNCFEKIDFVKYTKIFIPHYSEQHADHKAVNKYLCAELNKRGYGNIEVYQYETRSAVDEEIIGLDISLCIDKKLNMIREYKSQVKGYDYVAFVEALANYHAKKENLGEKYVEAYIKSNLDVSDNSDNEGRLLTDYRIKNEVLQYWLETINRGLKVSNYLKEKYRDIAIYGYGYFGRLLYDYLTSDGVAVKCVVDRRAKELHDGQINFVLPEDKQSVDLMIITNCFESETIKNEMIAIGYGTVLTLKDILVRLRS